VYTYNLAKELSKQHRVCVFFRVADGAQEECETRDDVYDGIRVRSINNTFKNYKSFVDTYRNDAIAQKFGEYLDEIKPDVVHFGHVTCLSTTCVTEAKRRGIRIVFTLHDYWFICPRGQFIRRDLSVSDAPDDINCVRCMAYQLNIVGGGEAVTRVFEKFKPDLSGKRTLGARFGKMVADRTTRAFFSTQTAAIGQIRQRTAHVREVLAQVDRFIAPSHFLRDKFLSFGIPASKITYADYGFDASLFAESARQPSEKIRFGYIGTLIPTKGIHVMINAFNRIADPRAELNIWGTFIGYEGMNDYGEYIESLAKNPNIHFKGAYHNKEIGKVLGAMDMLIVPSIWFENSPLTIHEAFFAGVPVLGSRIGGIAELVKEGKGGMNFTVGDDVDLARRITEVLKRPEGLQNLVRTIPPVRSIQTDAADILALYSVG
jgi:glycosyltransferase involved in cell wall biosynthesis